MNLIVQAVQLAWPAEKFEIMKEPDAERRFSKILTYYLFGLGFISLGFSVLARELLVVMTTPEYYSASVVIPLILLSYIFYGTRFITNVGLTRENRMEYGSMVIFGTAIINLGLNYWLIPSYGMLGAAWSTFISYGVLTISSTAINLHFWNIPYEYKRIIKVILAWALIYFVGVQIETTNLILSIFVKLCLIFGYPIFLYIIGFFSQEELLKLRQILINRTMKIKHLWKV
jgi:O-antigen/teichoic acid export membrane protein